MPRKDAVRTWVKFKSAKALAATLARVAKCADERSGCVTWEFAAAGSGLSAKSCEAGEASARLDCAIEGEAVKIGWNAGYVLEFLRVVGEGPVRMGIRDEKSAAVFEAEEGAGAGAGVGGWSYMLMPMRVLTAEAEREKG
jgi:DNA polymerase-3 subunit beta